LLRLMLPVGLTQRRGRLYSIDLYQAAFCSTSMCFRARSASNKKTT
jgi:hypothetical protein